MTYKVNSWDEFSPLKTLILGSVFDTTFFDAIKNKKIQYALKKVFEETQEDLEAFRTQMQSHGIKVFQAHPTEMGYKTSIMDYIDEEGRIGFTQQSEQTRTNLVPAPPLQVRDETIVMGNQVFVTEYAFTVNMLRPYYTEWFGEDNCNFGVLDGRITGRRTNQGISSWLKRWGKEKGFGNKTDYKQLTAEELEVINKQHRVPGFCAPNITRIGKHCLVDVWQTPDIKNIMSAEYPEFNYKEISLGGHNDSIFSVLKPGVVIAADWVREDNLQASFPGWEIEYFADPNWNSVNKWLNLKAVNRGAWWVPGQEDNSQFTHFVEQYLGNMTGEVEETVFDVNCLVLDDKHVVVNSDNPQLVAYLRKHNLEPVFSPFRNRFFFDGGWHCLTLDIERAGSQKDYGL